MSDYFLNKIYESVLKSEAIKTSEFKTLTETYRTIKEAKISPNTQTTSEFLDTQLERLLNDKKIKQKEPVGNYTLNGNIKKINILPEDMPTYRELFTESPPTKAGVPQSRGSGKGELSLFWLLRKSNNNVQDTRGDTKPDLTVNGIGVEVKSSPGGWISLGRFGDRVLFSESRKLLSILFGLKALFNISTIGTGQFSPPSIDDFDKKDLITAFEAVAELDKISKLRELALQFPPITSLYKQIDFLLSSLQLQSGDFEGKDGAAKLLSKLFQTKLSVKPGITNERPGYIINCFINGDNNVYYITQNDIDKLFSDPDKILNNVKAKGSFLQLHLGNLFG